MPRRLNNEDVRQKFIAAGYIPDNNFNYQNNKQRHRVYDILNNKYTMITLQTLNYNIKKGHRPLWEAITIPEPQNDEQPVDNSPLQRFLRSHTKQETLQTLPVEQQQQTFNSYQQLRRNIMSKRNFTYNFEQGNVEQQASQMRATILALHDSLSKIMPQHSIRLKVTTASGNERYFHVNPTTLSDLWAIFKDVEPDYSVEDSAGNFALDNSDIATIEFNFKPHKQGRQVAAGFFPFINLSQTDLTKYGIYSDLNDHRIAEPCLLTAFKASNIFTDDELSQLQEMVNTRVFPQVYLKKIHEHFRINIYIKHYHEQANKSKSSHVDYNNKDFTRSIRLMILYDHYMLYEKLPNSNKYTYSLVKDMIKNNKLRPLTTKEYEQVFHNIIEYKPSKSEYTSARPIVIRPPKLSKHTSYIKQFKQGKHFFGYEPDADEVNFRLDELQEFVDTLPLRHHINIRHYYKFSNLFLRIMYEYGAFDNVYEIAGSLRDTIRDSLVFPNRVMTTKVINEKCYYLDFNGAFCSFMTHIPTGPTADGPGNAKINELINLFYNKRIAAKAQGNIKFATTLKFMMCSCYGTSIRKPKLVKHKYSENIQGTINNQGDFVISCDNKTSGFVNIVQPYVEHYNFGHFAKVILEGFNNKLNEIKSLVTVLFQNIDAIVVSESDYNKLNALGYIHDTELGKLKVEHTFTRMKFFNKMRWYGVNLDGSKFKHCM